LKRKNYIKELKSKVALAAIKGNQTVNEIASEFGIHESFYMKYSVNAGSIPSFVKIVNFVRQAKAKEQIGLMAVS